MKQKKGSNTLVIVMPAYKELANLKKLLPIVRDTFSKNKITGGIVIVDDNSPDGSPAYLKKLQKTFGTKSFFLDLLLRPGKLGLGTAYIEGYERALKLKPGFVLGMDADFSHDPKYIPRIFKELHQYKMVIGSRYVPGGGVVNWSLWRKLVSKTASIYAKSVLRWSINDPTTAFVGFQAKTLDALPFRMIKTTGYSFLLELKYMAYKAGFSVKEIPIIFVDRAVGKSKLNKKIILEAVFNSFLVKFRKYK